MSPYGNPPRWYEIQDAIASSKTPSPSPQIQHVYFPGSSSPLPAPRPRVSETLGNVEERLGPKADSECIRLRDTAPTPRALSGASFLNKKWGYHLLWNTLFRLPPAVIQPSVVSLPLDEFRRRHKKAQQNIGGQYKANIWLCGLRLITDGLRQSE